MAVASGATGLDYSLRSQFKVPLTALLGVSIAVLLLSCVNLANLVLARGFQKQRDFAIRSALGASPAQILRQCLTESVVLLVFGLLLAWGLAYSGTSVVLGLLGSMYTGFLLSASVDFRAAVFAIVISAVTLLLSGLIPAAIITHIDISQLLRNRSASTSAPEMRLRRLLIAIQVALSLVLLIAAGGFVQAFGSLRNRVKIPTGILAIQLAPVPGGDTKGLNQTTYYQELLERERGTPGVQAASLSNFSPFFAMAQKKEIRALSASRSVTHEASIGFVTDRFFDTMGVTILRGSDFGRQQPSEEKTAILSRSAAERLFSTEDPLGQHVSIGADLSIEKVKIIRIVNDTVLIDPHDPDTEFVYLNFWQYPEFHSWANMELRSSAGVASLPRTVDSELKSLGHEYALRSRTLTEQSEASLLRDRLVADISIAFAILGLILAVVGLFGLLNFIVAARKWEFAVRTALGCQKSQLGWLLLRDLLKVISIGVVIGAISCRILLHIVSRSFYGFKSTPSLYLLSLAVLLITCATATALPTYRAVAANPVSALKAE